MPNQPALPLSVTYNYLTRALQLLEKPGPGLNGSSWIQHAEAITKDHHYCKPESEQADAWCTIGVLRAVTRYDNDPSAAYRYCYSILNVANPSLVAIGGSGLSGPAPKLNDSAYSFDQVRELFLNAQTWLLRHGA